jgi:hypothetical protein
MFFLKKKKIFVVFFPSSTPYCPDHPPGSFPVYCVGTFGAFLFIKEIHVKILEGTRKKSG